MDSKDYIEFYSCEKLLENIEVGDIDIPWEKESNEIKTVKSFLTHRINCLKRKMQG